jgi:predicted RNA methylase
MIDIIKLFILMSKTTGLKRNNNEQYYTKQDIANKCVKDTSALYNLQSFTSIIEPSAGTGAFLIPLQQYTYKLLAYDIDPKATSILKADYLTIDIEPDNILVIGNPPFGRQSSLAKQFVKHSCKFARVIAFILPRSFKKSSMYNAFSIDFHKVYECELPENSFIYLEGEYNVPCVFQIWERRKYNRSPQQKYIENGCYTIVKKYDNPNVSFRRVGVNAGNFTFDNFDALSIESHYFIKSRNVISNNLREQMGNIKWDTDNTTGPKSISKQELIQELNKILN